ncbi:MAG: extracellular solute-binding protein [Oscillospiraceae bacterium]|nr:extracellular solute-binding protein [Oscillospiraceae bacterium]
MKKTNRILTVVIFAFLYIPMLVLVVASFNTGKDLTVFEGFTFDQYKALFQDEDLLTLLGNSLLISILSTAIATAFGTLSAVGIHNLNPKLRKTVMGLTNIPMTNPDIVTGISLSLLFVFVGSTLLQQKESLNFWTLLIAHITFNLPYVILNVMPKLKQMNPALQDAAMDLGCTPVQSFFKVTIHEIMPGIVSGAIMAFTMSLDDFVISYFVSGNGFLTLPVEIYSYTKKPMQPRVYAMFTLLFLLIFVLMVTMNLLQLRADRKKTVKQAKSVTAGQKVFRRVCAGVCAAAIVLGCGWLIVSTRQDKITLNVMNWGQNIADGSDGTMDIIAAFEEAYPDIDVNYTTYDSNESLYAKLAGGGLTVDLIIPSDYMIARLRQENMLLPLNFDNIPNYKFVQEEFKNTDYDPNNEYSVPYTWGTVGILYNSKYVDEADVTGWELLWNEKYKGKILQFDNSRDAFGVAQFLSGISINTTNENELKQVSKKLAEQNPLVRQYVMDQIYGIMEGENAWIAPYYAGDCMMMMDANPDLRFYLPQEQGFNLFIDAMCIPTCSENKEAAEKFINFLCQPEISGANMDYICYASPIEGARDYMDEYLAESEVIYPEQSILDKGVSYLYLPPEINRLMDNLFLEVRISGNQPEETEEEGSALPVILTLAGLGAAAIFLFLPKRKRK